MSSPSDSRDRAVPSDPPALPATAESVTEAALVERYWGRLRLFAARRLGDVAAAEDVAQDTIRTVIEALRAGRVAEMAALPGYIFQTARHLCMHQYRATEREGRALQRLTPTGERVTDTDALASLIDAERCSAVRQALGRLPQDDRQLLHLLYFEQIEPDEIARQLDLSAGALRVRKHRALGRLAAALGEAVPGNDPQGSGT
jgi:RNA polymerase sigma-70 factor (ECF subfamily)